MLGLQKIFFRIQNFLARVKHFLSQSLYVKIYFRLEIEKLRYDLFIKIIKYEDRLFFKVISE